MRNPNIAAGMLAVIMKIANLNSSFLLLKVKNPLIRFKISLEKKTKSERRVARCKKISRLTSTFPK
jgi:hypothetical protein